jgi:hypothetical protein
MNMNGATIVDSFAKGYFIAATMRLLFNKSKNPLNMETVMNGAKIAAGDIVYVQFLRPVLSPVMGGVLPR